MRRAGALPSSLQQAATGGRGAPAPEAIAWRAPGWEAHALVLAICLGAIAVGLVLRAEGPGDRLTAAGLALPEICALRGVTGLPCPGCGLTRSWVAALRGDLATSLAHHLVGWLVLLYVMAQAVRHASWLALPARRHTVESAGEALDRGLVVLGVSLLAVWIPILLETLYGAR